MVPDTLWYNTDTRPEGVWKSERVRCKLLVSSYGVLISLQSMGASLDQSLKTRMCVPDTLWYNTDTRPEGVWKSKRVRCKLLVSSYGVLISLQSMGASLDQSLKSRMCVPDTLWYNTDTRPEGVWESKRVRC